MMWTGYEGDRGVFPDSPPVICQSGVDGGDYNVWERADVTRSIRRFLDHPELNFGFTAAYDTDKNHRFNAVGYCSSEYPTKQMRPKLVIKYTPGAAETTSYDSLTVESGHGDGFYEVGTVVNIKADLPAKGMKFTGWQGDTDLLEDPASASTTLTMGKGKASVAASYTKIDTTGYDTLTYKNIAIKSDITWKLLKGGTGSACINLNSADHFAVGMSVASLASGWARAEGTTAVSLKDAAVLRVLFLTTSPYRLTLMQDPLTRGTEYGIDIDSSNGDYLYIPIKNFAQPDTVSSANKEPLDLSKVTGIALTPLKEGVGTAVDCYELAVTTDPIKGAVSIAEKRTAPVSALRLERTAGNTAFLAVAESGIYTVDVFSLSGRKLLSVQKNFTAGSNAVDLENCGSGAFLITLRGSAVSGTFKAVIR